MLKPRDDYLHPVGPEPNFNESMYFHFHDPAHGVGGFLRLANRPNEGRGERTVCLYLPGGAVAFGFARPMFADNVRFCAGGLSVDILTPFEHLAVTFDGRTAQAPRGSSLRRDAPGRALHHRGRLGRTIGRHIPLALERSAATIYCQLGETL